MKIKFLTLLIIGIGAIGYSQAKKPTLLILPSDNWCKQRYFMTEFNNQGTIQKTPDYKKSFQEDTEIGQVISKIGSLMIDRGFPLKDAEFELKNIEARTSEDNMTQSNAASTSIAESQLNKLRNKVKPDIIIQIWWDVEKTAEGKVIKFTLEALDAYTSKRIAASTGFTEPNNKNIVAEQIQQAVLKNIDAFANQLQSHFNDMFANGREVIITLKRWENWESNFETEINDEEIIDHIKKWMNDNTVNHRFNMSDANENFIRFEQVRIPLFDKNNLPIDARDFGKGLQKHLKKAPFNFEVKLMTRGLGEAILVVGEK